MCCTSSELPRSYVSPNPHQWTMVEVVTQVRGSERKARDAERMVMSEESHGRSPNVRPGGDRPQAPEIASEKWRSH